MGKITIDPIVLESELSFLKSLRKTTPMAPVIVSEGHLVEGTREVISYVEQLSATLDQLVQHTIVFLENAKDSYIDVDETSAAVLSQLMEGSS